MAETLQESNLDDEDLYSLQENDLLGVLSSTRKVVEEGKYVWINLDRVGMLSAQWIQQEEEQRTPAQLWYDHYHFQDGSERTLHWLLVLDAMNFCFWSEKDQLRWQIEYKGEILNGYWAEAAALTRAVEEGFPLWDATFLSTLSSDTLAYIFRTIPGASPIPLFEQRLANAREVGRVLLEQFDGHFANALDRVEGDAIQLTLLLAEQFSSFNDIASYRNSEVRFFKRAQLCVSDIHGAFSGEGRGAFRNFDQLTAFADYKLPQVLRHFGVLEYHPVLAKRIDNQELIKQEEEAEIELRAATIWACELLKREMARQGYTTTAADIDQRLWLMGQQSAEMQPYHRTYTMYY
ncbi:MAG: queuosine salvage family protein [Chloroflexota bacterium]|nr:queuosine salvage family protein [Chloroflexota bacterium]